MVKEKELEKGTESGVEWSQSQSVRDEVSLGSQVNTTTLGRPTTARGKFWKDGRRTASSVN